MNQNGYDHCGSFVRMCGLDLATATAEDMDGADVFFRCEVCDSRRKPVKGFKEFALMRWRTAMNHRHVGKVCGVEHAELLALGRKEEKYVLENDLEAYDSRSLVCVHCNRAVYLRTGRAEHLRSEHG
ncbi:hypothetical protein BDZ89DRAFT_697802 [Hymenopellis radicata]|nr:hypothetical protein BDZ89DRAFT_697802 [Hymenopellis radicata]